MNTFVSNIGISGTLIALDIAKKHHDEKSGIRMDEHLTCVSKIHWKGSTDCLRSPLHPNEVVNYA